VWVPPAVRFGGAHICHMIFQACQSTVWPQQSSITYVSRHRVILRYTHWTNKVKAAITPRDNDTMGRIPHFILETISWETNVVAAGGGHDKQMVITAVEDAEERLACGEAMGINWWRSSIDCWVPYIPSPTITLTYISLTLPLLFQIHHPYPSPPICLLGIALRVSIPSTLYPGLCEAVL